jgi:putative hydrolase of the HAD superfamily
LWRRAAHAGVAPPSLGRSLPVTVKAVLFDLDETLIQRHAAIRNFIASQFSRFAEPLNPLTAAQYAATFLDLEDDGRADKAVVYPALVSSLGIANVSSDVLLADYRARYPSFAVLNPGAAQTLQSLRAHGLKLGVVTNGNGVVQNGKIDTIGLRPLLDCIVISELVGLRKPEAAIFNLAASHLGIEPAACVYVGDNPEIDVMGALGAGLVAIWFRAGQTWPATLPPPPHAIDTLPACLPLCGVSA